MRKLIMILAAATSLAAATPASADTGRRLVGFANRVSNAAGVQAGMGTPENSAPVSRTALAMFEAVNAIDRRYQSYLDFPAAILRLVDAAAATAAYKVLHQHFPAQRNRSRKAMR